MNDLHGIIFAYESSPKLRELTQHRNTSSIPYGGRYRMIDFMLSNMVNAGITDVGLVVHASYQSMLDHIGSGKDWDISRKRGGLRILPPFGFADQKRNSSDYRGRMDALAGVYSYLQGIRKDYVVLAGGDIAVNIALEDVFDAHIKSGADITCVCTKNPKGNPRECDYFTMGENGLISDVTVRPQEAMECESLGIFILSRNLLLSLVEHCMAHNIASMSEGVLQAMAPVLKLSPYYFDGFVARVQSVSGYYDRSMELLDPAIRADLFREDRPIRTKDQSNPSTFYGENAKSVNSLVADGCIIEGEVENSILFRGVHVAKGARVSNCILMQSTQVEEGAVLKYIITDKDVTVGKGRMLMGHDNYPVAVEKNARI